MVPDLHIQESVDIPNGSDNYTFAVPRQVLTVSDGWANPWSYLLRQKLLSIDTSKSPELKRMVRWTLHRFQSHHSFGFLDCDELESNPACLPEIHITLPCRKLYDIEGNEFCTDFENCKPRSGYEEVGLGLVLYDYFRDAHRRRLAYVFISSLIDRWVDFWNNMAEARSAWINSIAAFREFLNRNLRFKPLFSPLRLTPRSLHPIESAA